MDGTRSEALRSKLEMQHALEREEITLAGRKPIGKGSFSTVCMAYSARLKRTVAVKLIDTRRQTAYVTRFLPRELRMVPTLNHANIIKVHQVVRTQDYVAMVQDYAQNGDLLQLIVAKKRIDELEGRFLFRQLVEAIRYLEQNHIVHRDLKCENVFLDQYNNVKLGDFGFARYLYPRQETDTNCGSKAYVAPELLQGMIYTGNAADIWSAGVLLFIMLSGLMPFDDKNPQEMHKRQIRRRVPFQETGISFDAQQLIRHMLHPKKELRSTIQEVIDSAWLRSCRYFMRGRVEKDDSCSTASSPSSSESEESNL